MLASTSLKASENNSSVHCQQLNSVLEKIDNFYVKVNEGWKLYGTYEERFISELIREKKDLEILWNNFKSRHIVEEEVVVRAVDSYFRGMSAKIKVLEAELDLYRAQGNSRRRIRRIASELAKENFEHTRRLVDLNLVARESSINRVKQTVQARRREFEELFQTQNTWQECAKEISK